MSDKVIDLEEKRAALKLASFLKDLFSGPPPAHPRLNFKKSRMTIGGSVFGSDVPGEEQLNLLIFSQKGNQEPKAALSLAMSREQWEQLKAEGDRLLDGHVAHFDTQPPQTK